MAPEMSNLSRLYSLQTEPKGNFPKIFQHPIIHASIPRIAPIIEPHNSPARVSLDHHTVRMIGMTAGLSTIPLYPRGE